MNTSALVGLAGIDVRNVDKRFSGAPVLRRASLRVAPGRLVALLGPSGCGKTTLLRIVAGLERPDGGEVYVGDRLVAGPAAFVPPEQRRVGMVFQDGALFPHLSVAGNVGYGLSRGERRRGEVVARVLAMVGLEGLGHRDPATLSGGQQQRVALARALAPQPAVLLLDEPFSNLDTALRVQVRAEVHRLLADVGITTVFVTHDQEEAFLLGDEVAVMQDGQVVQQAAPAQLYAHPATAWVASFVGDANLVPGRADGARAQTPLGPVPLVAAERGPVDVLLRPEVLAVRPGDDGTVELVEFYGHDTVYQVRLGDGRLLRARVGAAPALRRGDRVDVSYAGPPTVAYPSPDGATAAHGRPLGADGGTADGRRPAPLR